MSAYLAVTVTPDEPAAAKFVGTHEHRPIPVVLIGDVTVNLGIHPDPAEWLRMAAAAFEVLAEQYAAAVSEAAS